MRRLIYLLGAALAAGTFAAPAALADDPPATPFPGKTADAFIYVDTVNGSRPKGAAPRPIGCTQINYFKRGEQLVFRVWGTETATGDPLSTANVKYAYVKVPGLPNMKLNWGPHGAASNRVWFWTAAWDIPADYSLGTVAYRVVFKTESNKFGVFKQTGLPTTAQLTITP